MVSGIRKRKTIINLKNVTKKYFQKEFFFKKREIVAISNLNLQVKKGEIIGLIGPNGAGKTTIMNMIVGFIKPSMGCVEVFGQGVNLNRLKNFREKLGYLPETPILHDYFKVEDLLDFYASFFGLTDRQKKERIDVLLEELGLEYKRKETVKSLSIGQKRILGLAQSLINDPELLILDEPTVYLDPLILNRFRLMLIKLREKGKTIFLSSHILSEVEKLSDRVAIINKGKLIALEETRELIKRGSLNEEFLRLINGDKE
ncbi:ABC transporter ATP-binding protein [bacterium]|nr:ABC transporter ATP-binding protein [bacterium]